MRPPRWLTPGPAWVDSHSPVERSTTAVATEPAAAPPGDRAASNGHRRESTAEGIARLSAYLDQKQAALGARRQPRPSTFDLSHLEQSSAESVPEAAPDIAPARLLADPPRVDDRPSSLTPTSTGDPAVAPTSVPDGLGPAPDQALTPHVEPAAVGPEWHRRNKRMRRAFVVFGWMRDIGLILILFAAWQLWGTSIQQSQSQQALHQQFQSDVQTHAGSTSPTPSNPTLVSANVRVPEPHEGSVVGRLQIPAIGVNQYVVEGTAEADLAEGPGHYVGTSMPGQAGNVAIAGHRTTYGAPFNNLNALKIGDPILLSTDTGEQLTYRVSAAPVAVSPHDVSVLNTDADNRLTLTTCNPRFSSTQRLVVVALLTEPHGTAATPVVKPHVVRITPQSLGWNMRYLPAVLLLIVLLCGLGLLNRRAQAFYGRIGRWLVLTPIWVAGLIFLFDLLTRLLPANL